MFNYQAARTFIEDAVAHYEQTAPQLSAWLDELYVALSENPIGVTVFELQQLQQINLGVGCGGWEHPHFAQNRWYKVRHQLGKPTGVISF